ncbi:hypothetical protein B0J17DRAFT_394983 [Rhizoctonia solani]|nr:hypothetical protein B0J17DRAFT_394983 [Rhizoctonia solani]
MNPSRLAIASLCPGHPDFPMVSNSTFPATRSGRRLDTPHCFDKYSLPCLVFYTFLRSSTPIYSTLPPSHPPHSHCACTPAQPPFGISVCRHAECFCAIPRLAVPGYPPVDPAPWSNIAPQAVLIQYVSREWSCGWSLPNKPVNHNPDENGATHTGTSIDLIDPHLNEAYLLIFRGPETRVSVEMCLWHCSVNYAISPCPDRECFYR